VAAAEARVSAAVGKSNVAWMQALETASPLGLDRIKMGSNLQSILREVTRLREHDEYWQIDVQQVRVIWARLLSPTHARALVRKIGESRRLYRRGRATPLEVDNGSYTNLYDLNRVDGRWLVWRVAALDDATAARLATAPPVGY
jgi:ARC6-like, IMS domain